MQQLNKEIKEVVRLRNSEDLTWKAIGEKLGVSRHTAARRYDIYLLQNEVSQNGYFVPEGSQFDFSRFQPLERTGDCIISMDWHIPLHDPLMVNNLIAIARENDIKQLVIAGDLLHLDSFSSFFPHQPEADFLIERKEATSTVRTLLKTFDEIDLTWGNHEQRISRFVNYKYSFEVLMRWIFQDLTKAEHKRIRISNLDHLMYKTEDRVFRVCHPNSFSKIPLKIPRELAQKYGTSVINAHSHHCAMGVAPDGHNLIFEGGGLFDKSKTEYIQRTTLNHEWVQGFVMFKGNTPTLYSPAFNNL